MKSTSETKKEIDPVELAKIKKIISNMFDYKGSPMPNQTTPTTNALADAANAAADAAGQLAQGAKDSIAKAIGCDRHK